MYRKVIAGILILATILSCCGCSALFDEEYSSSEQHTSNTAALSSSSAKQFEVSNYTELCSALLDIVSLHISIATIRFKSYDGVPGMDIDKACGYVSSETAYGAYAASYIKYSMNKIVSYYEAVISVTYRRTFEETVFIKETPDIETLRELLLTSISEHKATLTVLTKNNDINAESIAECISDVYYANPDLIPYMPGCSVASYPENSFQRILEISFEYPYGEYVTASRSQALEQSTNAYLESIDASSDNAVYDICTLLLSSIELQQDDETPVYTTVNNENTAYGALVLGKASSEGLSMALKLLCNKLSIDCEVVTGLHNNISHTWNIVSLPNGFYYHMDLSHGADDLFRTDSEMPAEYWWDEGHTPCVGPSVLYDPVSTDPGTEPLTTDAPAGTQAPGDEPLPPTEDTAEEPLSDGSLSDSADISA